MLLQRIFRAYGLGDQSSINTRDILSLIRRTRYPTLLKRELYDYHLGAEMVDQTHTQGQALQTLQAESQRLAELEASLEHARNREQELIRLVSSRDTLIGKLNTELSEKVEEADSQRKYLERLLILLTSSSANEEKRAQELNDERASKREVEKTAAAELSNFRRILEKQRRALAEVTERISASQAKVGELGHLLSEAERGARQRETELRAILSSNSWRMTSLFRKVSRGISKVRQFVQRRPFETPHFEEQWYLTAYPDVKLREMDAYEHYLCLGAAEGRNPNPWFDSRWYLRTNADVRQAGLNAHAHFLGHGAQEGRHPHPKYSTTEYLRRYPLPRAK